MGLALPPGVAYIVQAAPRLLAVPATVTLLRIAARDLLGVAVPTWLYVLFILVAFPFALFVSIAWKDYVDEREARKLGAVLPPYIENRWPGGLETMKTMVHNFKHGYPAEPMVEWSEKYGHTFNLRVAFENRMFTTEPEYIKTILASQFDNFEKGPVLFHQLHSLLGSGVFNSDGEMWKFHRAMTRPFFSRERIAHFDLFDRHAEEAIGLIKSRIREGYPVEFQDMVSRFTLDSATEFLFGNNVHSLGAGLPYPSPALHGAPAFAQGYNKDHPANHFAKAFGDAQSLAALRSRRGIIWPLTEFWRDDVKTPMRTVDAYIRPILQNAIARKQAEGASIGGKRGAGASATELKAREVQEGETLLDHLINYTEDPEILKDEILNMLVAGRDTTAATLTFIFYMLAEHPDVLARLRAEVLEKVGRERRPTYDDFRDMKYLRAVINETLRLYPVVPFNLRCTTTGVLWPAKETGAKPFYIPPNTKTPYSIFLMHRRKDLWGPDALQFDPDRFLDERLGKYLTPNPFIFLPFNAGPRICLGQQFAYNEMSFMIVRMLQSFDAFSIALDAQVPDSRPPAAWGRKEGPQGTEKLWPKVHLTMYAHDGVWMRMREASYD